ncbi:hypothetical protein KQX54_015722 [Cotesia glomerata]|uniref:Uncharacterized protein n=1 Tax=Cotesia glomerata TaxID=32391 RepID=A0AAV7IKK9_COTGL|nr:hypothetical protein KQX54_015722 [Cotesia glomerata]
MPAENERRQQTESRVEGEQETRMRKSRELPTRNGRRPHTSGNPRGDLSLLSHHFYRGTDCSGDDDCCYISSICNPDNKKCEDDVRDDDNGDDMDFGNFEEVFRVLGDVLSTVVEGIVRWWRRLE